MKDLEDQLFQSQRTQKKLEKDVANRQAQEEKLQVKYCPIILDGELLIMQISSFPSVRGFSSEGMICPGSNALALSDISAGFRVQNTYFSPLFQRKIIIIAFFTGVWRTSMPKNGIWMNRESYILLTNWKGNTCWILFCVLPKQWIKVQFCAICIYYKEVYSWEDRRKLCVFFFRLMFILRLFV